MRICLAAAFLLFNLPLKAVPFHDSVITAASRKYTTHFALRNAFVGTNYRETWATMVKMPVFHIDKEMGGFKITKLGGGAQTASLRMKDSKGIDWVLRTVDKDVRIIVPKLLRGTPIHGIMQDIISTAYPYAPLVVADLAKRLKVAAPSPRLFYVPDDPAFGEHRKKFANVVAMLEKLSPTYDDSEALESEDFLKLYKEGNNLKIDDTMYLRGRLLDMLIADWDRHNDQLEWGISRNGNKTLYYPIFRDRDQAFFYSDGLILMKTRWFVLRHFTNFTKSFKRPVALNWKGSKLDKMILKDFTEDAWKSTITTFQQTLTDDAIDSAISCMPPEVVKADGQHLSGVLKARRDLMMKRAMKYYRSIAKNKR